VSLILFRKKKFAGESHPVARSHGNLRITPVGYRTRSLAMTSRHDRALLFSKRMYRGQVAYTQGVQDVADSANTFLRRIRSVRVDPFTLHLHVTVVRSGRHFPGWRTDEREVFASIDTAIDWANRVWSGGMLWLERRHTEVWNAPGTFDLRWPLSRVPAQWRRPGMISVVFVNRVGRRGRIARRWPPFAGDTIVVGRVARRGEIRDDMMGYGLARELGRYLGLRREPQSKDPWNLMCRGRPPGLDPARIHLLPEQIQEVHRVLAFGNARADRHN